MLNCVDTNELAKVKVDPLRITDLRVRGMWHIENPLKVFQDVAHINGDNNFTVNTLWLADKYNSFPEKDRKKLERLQNENFRIQDVEIKSPNNPAQLLKTKVVTFVK